VTARQLIYSALRFIGVLRTGQTASAEAEADGLQMLQSMIDQWQIERLMIYTIERNVFNLVASQQVYTAGSGGNWNIPRPARIDRAGIIIPGTYTTELPLRKISIQQWAQEYPAKTVTSSLPTVFYEDGGFPLINVTMWPVPSVGNTSVALYTWSPLQSFSDLTTSYTFPPGYDLALRFNLGEMLWPMFVVNSKSNANGMQLQMVQKMARQAKAQIKTINQPVLDMRIDSQLTRNRMGFNWITGE
jgi:hypothetical protein